MHQQWQPGLRNVRQRRLQLLLVDHRKAIAAGIDQEALEPRHAGRSQRQNVLLIVRDRAAPADPVHHALTPRRRALYLERRNRRRLRQTVQRHIHQRCIATRSCGACRRVKALPLGASGLVDVDVACLPVPAAGRLRRSHALQHRAAPRTRGTQPQSCRRLPAAHRLRTLRSDDSF